jgi:hypothetical protein
VVKKTTQVAAKKAARKKASAKRAPAKKAPAKTKPARTKPTRKAPTERRGRGQPTKYTEALGRAICGWKRQGYTLRQIAALPDMPSKTTMIRWLAVHDDFCDQYVRAGEVVAVLMCEEIPDIVDDGRNDWMERELKSGEVVPVVDREALELSRMRVDARFRLMEKMAPKRYGKRTAVTGKDGGPVQVQSIDAILDDIDGAGTGLPGDGE